MVRKCGPKGDGNNNERRRARCSVLVASLLGPLKHNRTITMTLDCYPIPCPCGQHERQKAFEQRTHPKGATCPFSKDHHPRFPGGSCCSCLIGPSALVLAALGELAAFDHLRETVSAEDTVRVAKELRAAADRIQQEHPSLKDERAQAFHCVNVETGECLGYERRLTDAVNDVRAIADWYEKVGSMHYGVKGLRRTP